MGDAPRRPSPWLRIRFGCRVSSHWPSCSALRDATSCDLASLRICIVVPISMENGHACHTHQRVPWSCFGQMRTREEPWSPSCASRPRFRMPGFPRATRDSWSVAIVPFAILAVISRLPLSSRVPTKTGKRAGQIGGCATSPFSGRGPYPRCLRVASGLPDPRSLGTRDSGLSSSDLEHPQP